MSDNLEFYFGCFDEHKQYRKQVIDGALSELFDQVRQSTAKEMGIAKVGDWDWSRNNDFVLQQYEAACKRKFEEGIARISAHLVIIALKEDKSC
jgi:hypothetical protein